MSRLLIVAGDASGDLHAAALVQRLRERRPDLRICGLGGPAMQKAGVELVADASALAVGGLLELGASLHRIVQTWRVMGRALERERPDLVVLVDSGGFNLPFARRVRRRSSARLLYYVAPQVWAWRRGRIRKLARRVDRLALIFPFEVAAYAETGVRADFVGHPRVDELGRLRERLDRESALRCLDLDTGPRWIALLPGSRRNEIRHHLPIQLDTARQLHARDPRLSFAVGLASSIDPDVVSAGIRAANLPELLELRLVHGRTPELIRGAHAVLAKPGTVTVEAALLARPMVVMGVANALTAAIVRKAVRLPFFAMPNLIADEAVVPEFLQQDARPEALADALQGLVEGPARERQLAALARVRERLGEPGAAARAASIAEDLLDAPRRHA